MNILKFISLFIALFFIFFVLTIAYTTFSNKPKKADYDCMVSEMEDYVEVILYLEKIDFSGKIISIHQKEVRGWDAFCLIESKDFKPPTDFNKNDIFLVKNQTQFSINFTYKYIFKYYSDTVIQVNDIVKKERGSLFYNIYDSDNNFKIKIPIDPKSLITKNNQKIMFHSFNGSLIAEIYLINDKKNGLAKFFYRNRKKGVIFQEINFINGIREGDSRIYYYDGQIAATGKYKNNLKSKQWMKYTIK